MIINLGLRMHQYGIGTWYNLFLIIIHYNYSNVTSQPSLHSRHFVSTPHGPEARQRKYFV